MRGTGRRWIAPIFGALVIGWLITATPSQAEELQLFSPTTREGTLVICGGGRLPEAVYEEFIERAGGKSARIVHIPWAHPFRDLRAAKIRYSGWLSYKVRSFDFLAANSHSEADDDAYIKPLATATGVWIGGGSQGRLANLYRGTKVEAALKKVLERGGVIGGTSAGAAILSRTMIRYDEAFKPTIDEGFDLLQSAVIDQHFSQRGRLTRLMDAVDDRPGMVGLGVDEGTALFVQGNRLRAVGKSQVTVIIAAPRGEPTLLYRLHDNDQANLLTPAKAGQPSLLFAKMK